MSDEQDPASVDDLEAGLRFLHSMSSQTKLSVERLDALVAALLRELERRDVVKTSDVHVHMEEAQEEVRARTREQLRVEVSPVVDKHTVTGRPIDCTALLPLCKGRCCRMTVHLSHQDLDDGLRWEYERPYELKRGADSYCGYHVETGCSIYDKRPATCRSYDCRSDKRIWIDFEKQIPAPMEKTDRDSLLIQIQKARR